MLLLLCLSKSPSMRCLLLLNRDSLCKCICLTDRQTGSAFGSESLFPSCNTRLRYSAQNRSADNETATHSTSYLSLSLSISLSIYLCSVPFDYCKWSKIARSVLSVSSCKIFSGYSTGLCWIHLIQEFMLCLSFFFLLFLFIIPLLHFDFTLFTLFHAFYSPTNLLSFKCAFLFRWVLVIMAADDDIDHYFKFQRNFLNSIPYWSLLFEKIVLKDHFLSEDWPHKFIDQLQIRLPIALFGILNFLKYITLTQVSLLCAVFTRLQLQARTQQTQIHTCTFNKHWTHKRIQHSTPHVHISVANRSSLYVILYGRIF